MECSNPRHNADVGDKRREIVGGAGRDRQRDIARRSGCTILGRGVHHIAALFGGGDVDDAPFRHATTGGSTIRGSSEGFTLSGGGALTRIRVSGAAA